MRPMLICATATLLSACAIQSPSPATPAALAPMAGARIVGAIQADQLAGMPRMLVGSAIAVTINTAFGDLAGEAERLIGSQEAEHVTVAVTLQEPQPDGCRRGIVGLAAWPQPGEVSLTELFQLCPTTLGWDVARDWPPVVVGALPVVGTAQREAKERGI